MNQKTTNARRILVVRTDRIGDLILSTPLLTAIRTVSPDARITMLVPRYAAPVLERNGDINNILPWDDFENGTTGAREIAAGRFDAAILLNPCFRSGSLLRRAGISFRTGPLARPASFLFLNRGIRQARSRSTLHQAEHDSAFAPLVTGGKASGTPPPTLVVSDSEREAGRRALDKAGVRTGRLLLGLHPGSGNSSLTWPLENSVAMARKFISRGWQVVVTGSEMEKDLATKTATAIGNGAVSVAGNQSLRLFFGILSCLDHFIAPSTGPLHAAAALGVGVSAVFPPLPSQSADRWGPRTDRAAIVTPAVSCPARIRCRGARCRHHPCMEGVEVDQLLEATDKLLPSREIHS